MIENLKLTQEVVTELLDYDEVTGKLTWKERDIKWFNSTKAQFSAIRWNTKYAGKEALTALVSGYKTGSLFHKSYRSHRIIWLWMTGEWPKDQIDHINGIRTDNRWENLREVTIAENGKNRKIYKNNSSGFLGVSWNKRNKRWQTQIEINGKKLSLGNYVCLQEAIEARKAANVKYGFHPNHGKR